jgi:hypothetical protein
MYHKNKEVGWINLTSFNISITLILNAWVGKHPTTKMCLIFQRAFHTNVTKITNADTINNMLKP